MKIFLLLLLIFLPLFSSAQEITEDKRKALENDLKVIETQIKEQEEILKTQKKQSSSISRDIEILSAKIKKAQLDIKAKNIVIQRLSGDINNKDKKINSLENEIVREKKSLGNLLSETYMFDDYSLTEMILSKEDFSEIFVDIDNYQSINENLRESYHNLEGVKDETTIQKLSLEEKKNAETDAKISIEKSKREIEKNQKEKDKLLKLSKQKEASYSAIIREREAKAAQIRAALFSLRDAGEIPFGLALDYANNASKKTGVRPAMILAILTQESALGKNVGNCYITDSSSGRGMRVSNGQVLNNVMHPTRDIPEFIAIAKSLGRDPYKTRVSCPLSYGWGGAMGPSQFIPSTWKMYKSKVESYLGKTAADPWNPEDAFMATAIYLKDSGAGSKTYSAERNAACRYYSGKSCGAAKSPGSTYGNQVMAKARNIQENMIDPLNND